MILQLLGIAFVVLKLMGIITWAWVWVASPFIAVAVFWLLFWLLAVLMVGTARR